MAPPRSTERLQIESVPCPTCNAPARTSCTPASIPRGPWMGHAARRRACGLDGLTNGQILRSLGARLDRHRHTR